MNSMGFNGILHEFNGISWRFHEDLVIYLGINSGPCMSHSGGWVKIEAL